jgi:ribosomal protein L37E
MVINREKIAKIINEKGATQPCQRCGHSEFTVLEGFTNIQLQEKLSPGIVIGGGTIVPVAHIVCNNCGAITSHAIGALGMLSRGEASNET